MSVAFPAPIQSGDPGMRVVGDDLAPYYVLESNDRQIEDDISRFITGVEFESAVDMADLMTISIANPGVLQDGSPGGDPLAPPDWGTHKVFAPGNEINLFMGYGMHRPKFIGRVHIAKHMPVFPREGVPTLEIKGYDKSYLMMDTSGNVIGSNLGTPRLRNNRPVGDRDDQGQPFQNVRHSDIVRAIAQMYGFELDMDATQRPENFTLKKGMKHYEVVKGLANINDREFWVDFDINIRKWVLHWRRPARNERSTYTFQYNAGDQSTLLEFEPEYGLRDSVSEATILVFDNNRQRWVSAIEIEEFEAESPVYRQGGGLQARAQGGARGGRRRQLENQEVINEALENPAAFRISAGGIAIDVLPPGRRFEDAETAARFLRRWFLARRDHFVTGRGVVVGVETLKARQVHTINGIGNRLSGDYYFQTVRHKQGDDAPYVCEFTAHKVMTGDAGAD